MLNLETSLNECKNVQKFYGIDHLIQFQRGDPKIDLKRPVQNAYIDIGKKIVNISKPQVGVEEKALAASIDRVRES